MKNILFNHTSQNWVPSKCIIIQRRSNGGFWTSGFIFRRPILNFWRNMCHLRETFRQIIFSFVWFYTLRLQMMFAWPAERNSLDHHRGLPSQKAVTSQILRSPSNWRVIFNQCLLQHQLKIHTAYRNSNQNHEACKISFLNNFYTKKSHQ